MVVEVGKTITLSLMLRPGEVKDVVTVTTNLAEVETQTSDIGTSVTPQEIKDLPVPLSGDSRNPLSFRATDTRRNRVDSRRDAGLSPAHQRRDQLFE